MTMLIRAKGAAYFVYVQKSKRILLRCAMPATVRLAEAPMSVPLPPKQAPSESAHHKGSSASSPPSSGARILIKGIIAATNGILSMMAERIADAQRIADTAKARL